MTKLIPYLDRVPRPILGVIALILVPLISLLDFVTGWELACSLFYLAPILLVTWYVSRLAGNLMALLCGAAWGAVYAFSQPPSASIFSSYWNAGVALLMFLVVVQILSALKEALRQEHDLARTDSLTGAANNRAFYERLEEEIARARRYKRSFTVAYIDVDDFKMVNDRQGHSAGDTLLCTVAETLQGCVRDTDVVARLGGDEFALLFVETGYQLAERTIDRVQGALIEATRVHAWPISFSIGAVTCSGHVEGVDSVIRRADELMYTVKRSTKNDIRHERYHETEQVA